MLPNKTWLLLATTLLINGCTVSPDPVKGKVSSFDGNEHNSGFIGYAPDGAGILTLHKAAEYNALIPVYGERFVPPLKAGDGLTLTSSNACLIDKEHLVDFGMMVHWKRGDVK